jgi:POT family proton-dependent oligopeptide transporter
MMFVATIAFYLGRAQVSRSVPPAGKAWLHEVFSPRASSSWALLLIYFFVAGFWMLWDQSNGKHWTCRRSRR